MKRAFYKNWKKMALVLTSMFWASCGDDASSTAPTTSSESSSSIEENSSDSTTPGSSGAIPTSSSSTPDNRIACTETTFEKKYADWSYQTHGVKCEDGEEYELESICPDYGIDSKCSDIYIGKNGKVYSEEEFKEIYKMASPEAASSSSSEPGNVEFNEPVACELQQLCPAYGIIYNCDGVKTTSRPENAENCTQEVPSCTKEYICEDGMVCKESSVDDTKKYDCKEGTFIMPTDKITATYSESEFNSRYYVKDKP